MLTALDAHGASEPGNHLFEEHIQVIRQLHSDCSEQIQKLGEIAASTLMTGKAIYLCGNGGSAADAQHLAAEIVGRFEVERKGYSAIALTVDTSILTAITNDYGYEHVFSRQIEALGSPGDLLIGISTSGNSPNVIAALKSAKNLGLYSVGLAGNDGGALKDVADLCIIVPSANTARIQEAHILIGHTLCSIIDAKVKTREAKR